MLDLKVFFCVFLVWGGWGGGGKSEKEGGENGYKHIYPTRVGIGAIDEDGVAELYIFWGRAG